jgi:hypothetical protein
MAAHDWTTRARVSGIVAAILAAAIYGLIGLGRLSVGESTTEATTDLFMFGVLMAAISAATAVAMWWLQGSVGLWLVAAFQLTPLLGYVAAAGMREPPFELWGVLIKTCQLTVLVAASFLALEAGRRTSVGRASTKGHPA